MRYVEHRRQPDASLVPRAADCVALAWVISHESVVVIPAASDVAQLEANVTAADVTLAHSERTALTEPPSASTRGEPSADGEHGADAGSRRYTR
jgi:aryl-alcohol dehydrogenase-like predicted oxidoreductase